MKKKLTLTTTLFFLSIIIHTAFTPHSPLKEGCPKDGVFLFGTGLFAQNVGINGSGATAHASALLDLDDAFGGNNKGLLIPRIALTAINVAAPVTSPATSLLVYNTASASVGSNAVSPGYYYWDGAKWVRFAYNASGSSSTAWDLLGNAGTNPTTNFLGTTDAQDLVFRTNNTEKMRILSNGNVGIGLINPLYKLHVFNGSAKVDGTSNTGSNGALMMFGLNNSTDIGYVGDGSTTDNNMYLYSYNNDVRIGTGVSSSASNSIYLDQLGNTGVGTVPANASAKLDVVSTTAGFAMPRMTSVQRKAIVAPIDGLQVYDTNLKGYYTYDGTKWDCVTTPAGTVNYFANTTAPNGYLIGNGQAVNRTTYAELFAAIGTLYGAGDGTTTFNVPDLRGEFIRGAALTGTVDAGRTFGSKQAGTIVNGDFDPSPTPSSMQASTGSYQSNYGADSFDATVYSPVTTIASWNAASGTYNQASGSNNFGITRPRNIALLPCIKY